MADRSTPSLGVTKLTTVAPSTRIRGSSDSHMTWPSFCLSGMWPSQATITQRGMTVSPGQDILMTTRVFFLSPFTDSVSRV